MLRPGLLGGLFLILAPALAGDVQLGVYLDFEHPASPAALEAMRATAAETMQAIGFNVAWRLVSENRGDEAFENLAVVKFTGDCACRAGLRPYNGVLVLGTTAVQDGRVLPYSEVRCDAVRRILSGAEFDSNQPRGDASLGRALGRVLAHELYHAVTGTTHHTAAGIAKAIQSSRDLTSADFTFDADRPAVPDR